MNYTLEQFKKDLFTDLLVITENVDLLEGFDCNCDDWWSGEKELQIDYDDCIAFIKCHIELNADSNGEFCEGKVSVLSGGTTSLVSEIEHKFSISEEVEISKYLTW